MMSPHSPMERSIAEIDELDGPTSLLCNESAHEGIDEERTSVEPAGDSGLLELRLACELDIPARGTYAREPSPSAAARRVIVIDLD